MTVVVGGRKCHCPNRGCLEAYAGGWAIKERTQEVVRTSRDEGKRILELSGSVEAIEATMVTQAYREGDRLAGKLVRATFKYLSAGVVSIVNAFNPCLLVFGGGISEGIPDLVQNIEILARKNALEAALEKLEFTKAKLGKNAGVIGAAAFANTFRETI